MKINATKKSGFSSASTNSKVVLLTFFIQIFLFISPQTGKSQDQSYQLSSKSESIIYRLSLEIAPIIKAQILDSLEKTAFAERFDSLEYVLSSIQNNDSLELQVLAKVVRESRLLDRENDAYKYAVRMLYLAEKLADSTSIAYACYEIGNNIRLGVVSGSPYEAYYKRASLIFETLPDPLSQSIQKYLRILLTNDKSASLSLAIEAIELLKNNLDESDKPMMELLARHLNVAGLYAEESQSLAFYEEGLKIAQIGENYLMQAFILNNMGYGFQTSGQYHQAIPYYLRALDISLSVGLKSRASNSLNNLTTCYRELRDFEKALLYQNALFEMTFSVMNDKYYESLAREKIKNDVDRVELKNNLLSSDLKLQNRQRLALVVVLVILLLIALYIFWSRRKINIANQKLKALDKVKTRFFANISHELRTPITLINGPLQAVIDGDFGKIEDAAIEQLQVAKNNGKNLQNLVTEILDLSKLEAGKLRLSENPVKFYPFLKELLAAYTAAATARSIDLRLDYEYDREISLMMDEAKFSKIVNNLLSNAFKFSHDNSGIVVCVREGANSMLLSVKDNGEGIDPEDIEFIFDRFYQSERPNTKARGGTGIGLALAMELAKLLGGSLSVTSQLGKGSEFTLSFPMKVTQSYIAEVNSQESSSILVTTSLKSTLSKYIEVFKIEKPILLLTEDHNEMRNFIAQIVAPYFSILEAKDGEEALYILKHNHVDMIISDVMMPKMDGFELLEKIKADEKLKYISMIMLTARAAEEDKLFALTLGVDDYLTKPFSREELLVRARNILDNRIIRKISEQEEPIGEDISNLDTLFVDELKILIEKYINDNILTVSFLASEFAMSERQLRRKSKLLTGLSPVEFIKEVRLQKSRVLLEKNQVGTVAEAAYAVGFDKVSYFSDQFTNRFGKRPSEVRSK